METTILLVEDDQDIRELITLYLENEGFKVLSIDDGLVAKEAILSQKFDLAILDIMLPKVDGLTLLSLIRKKESYPVIMLTAKGEDIDKITGLNFGADDYITKPFKPLEVIARVKAQLRRFNQYNPRHQNVLYFKELELNIEKHQAMFNNKILDLTPKEFSILKLLLENIGNVVSSENIFKMVWQEKYYSASNNTIMVHIRHLREKMNDIGDKPNYIKTVWGVGYKID
ncbi:response regulator transcription factor [Vagococcus vulneris]|uniref:DNA-binding response regulator n=1 Tax=Vagococcus vulneris TaxID=1977869 RepID=A0A429ZWU5_9ENTE|nr:response regulator transcription factor [Vagococcus vulneris]RST98107.1 DNA-binding response regulator [Vagococcus vulneris]